MSRDGKFAAFLSDRDGRTDVWVTQIGTGEFHNLTQGRAQELLNDDLRTVAFSPDGSLVLFWERTSAPADGLPAISVWAVPTMGGALRRYLPGGAEVDWSSDGTRVVYHPPAEGDPLFVTDAIDRPGRQIHVGSPGVHNHFPLWAPDDAYVYFVQGAPGVATDLWRVEPDGGRPGADDLARIPRESSCVHRASHSSCTSRRSRTAPGHGCMRSMSGAAPRAGSRRASSVTARSRRARTDAGSC